jgi:hypothetical protein
MEYTLYRAVLFLRTKMESGNIPVRRHGLSHVETYDVTADELERIEREGSDVGFDFQISQFCLTVAISFFVGLILSPPPDSNPKTFIVFVVLVVVGVLVGFIFGIKWYKNRGAFSRTISRIKERQIGPVGEEGKELKAGDLEKLTPSEPKNSGAIAT